MTGHVDGVVVGSALVEVLERGEDPAHSCTVAHRSRPRVHDRRSRSR